MLYMVQERIHGQGGVLSVRKKLATLSAESYVLKEGGKPELGLRP